MKKILIIEDDSDFQDIYTLYFQGADYEVLRAFNGKQGLEVLEKETPDLIILDLIMPVMDGDDFYERLRANEKWQNIPVIIASVNDKMPPKMAELGGVAGSLRKPFDIDELLRKVQTCLG
jgi:DNA-binding response OmpR family regulator